MKIVILDGYTMNPGDLDWQGFNDLGDLTVHDRTPYEQTIERAQGAEAVLTNKTVLDRDIIGNLPGLNYIGVLATGVNVVDVDAAQQRGIVVTNVPGYSTESVAQAAFALILELSNSVGIHNDAVHKNRWIESQDFCFWIGSLRELKGQTLGIMGFGSIGKAVCRIALAFGMNVIVNSRTPKDVADVEFVSVEELFRRSDILTIHCPLTPQTECVVNEKSLASMKPSALLINTGRGGLVDEAALAKALDNEVIAAAGLDVLSTEPPAPENPLLKAKNCIMTPHIAWATFEARKRLMNIAVNNLKSFVDGSPENVVG